MFQDGSIETISSGSRPCMRPHDPVPQRPTTLHEVSQHIRREQAAAQTMVHASVPSAAHVQSCNTSEKATFSHASPAEQEPILTCNTPTDCTPGRKQENGRPHHWPQSVPSQQFQVLFNSLFKVLFIFPSRYLFAIGLVAIFSFRRSLPPNLGCITKQPDS